MQCKRKGEQYSVPSYYNLPLTWDQESRGGLKSTDRVHGHGSERGTVLRTPYTSTVVGTAMATVERRPSMQGRVDAVSSIEWTR